MFDTLVDDNDQSDLSELYSVIDEIAPNLENGCILYVTSQVPVGTCDKIRKTVSSKNLSLKFDVAYSPENLRLGKAICRLGEINVSSVGSVMERVIDLKTCIIGMYPIQ